MQKIKNFLNEVTENMNRFEMETNKKIQNLEEKILEIEKKLNAT